MFWALLVAWLLGERSLHDRAGALAAADAAKLGAGLDAATLPRRRLTRVALGPSDLAAGVAAAELVRRDPARLRAVAASGRRRSRLQALVVLARGRAAGARDAVRAVLESGSAATSDLLRLAGELAPEEGDELLLDVLVAGSSPRSRTATELEPRTARLRGRLVALTSSDDPELRYWAVSLLRLEQHDPAAAAAVCARSEDASPSVRAAVAEALGFAAPGSARPLLRALLADHVFYVRAHAARAVGQSGDEELAEELEPLLADRNWWVRAAAKEGLAALGERGLAVAVAALSHPDPFARDGALEILVALEHAGDLDTSEIARSAVSALRAAPAELDVARVA
jgi:HEAT repeat protein